METPDLASSDRLTFAKMIAPAARSFATVKASSGARLSTNAFDPPVVGRSKVS